MRNRTNVVLYKYFLYAYLAGAHKLELEVFVRAKVKTRTNTIFQKFPKQEKRKKRKRISRTNRESSASCDAHVILRFVKFVVDLHFQAVVRTCHGPECRQNLG